MTNKRNKMNKPSIDEIRIGSDELNSMIEAQIEELMLETEGQQFQIDEFEVSSVRNQEDNCFDVEITIYGFAGTPTYEDFLIHEKVQSFSVEREDFGEIEFEIDEERSTILNSNDYLIAYKSV